MADSIFNTGWGANQIDPRSLAQVTNQLAIVRGTVNGLKQGAQGQLSRSMEAATGTLDQIAGPIIESIQEGIGGVQMAQTAIMAAGNQAARTLLEPAVRQIVPLGYTPGDSSILTPPRRTKRQSRNGPMPPRGSLPPVQVVPPVQPGGTCTQTVQGGQVCTTPGGAIYHKPPPGVGGVPPSPSSPPAPLPPPAGFKPPLPPSGPPTGYLGPPVGPPTGYTPPSPPASLPPGGGPTPTYGGPVQSPPPPPLSPPVSGGGAYTTAGGQVLRTVGGGGGVYASPPPNGAGACLGPFPATGPLPLIQERPGWVWQTSADGQRWLCPPGVLPPTPGGGAPGGPAASACPSTYTILRGPACPMYLAVPGSPQSWRQSGFTLPSIFSVVQVLTDTDDNVKAAVNNLATQCTIAAIKTLG